MPGSYIFSGYSSTDNPAKIYPIRVQPETLALVINQIANDAPTGGTTESVSARVSGKRRTFGVNARTVTIEFVGTAPTGYKVAEPIRLPILKPDVWADIVKNQSGTYLNNPIRVIGKKPEYIN